VALNAQGVPERTTHQKTVTSGCYQIIMLQKNDKNKATQKHPCKVTGAAISHYN